MNKSILIDTQILQIYNNINLNILNQCINIVKEYFQLHKSTYISLHIVNKKEMTEIHDTWLHNKYPTDILSFKLNEPQYINSNNEQNNIISKNKYLLLLGEIIICYDVIQDNTNNDGTSLIHETILLIIHGMLHILDYNHDNKIDRKTMFTLQKKIIDIYFNNKIKLLKCNKIR